MVENANIVIGSGLTGPLLSILLKQRNYSVTMYEKRSDIRNADISSGRSINLALSHRGISALKAANVFEEVEPILIPMRGRMIHHINGKLEYQPYSIYKNEYIRKLKSGFLRFVRRQNSSVYMYSLTLWT